MNKDQIIQLVNSLIAQSNKKDQYSVGPVTSHEHNGVDSNKIAAQNLIFTNFATWGTVTANNSGSFVITNPHIRSTSVILVTDQNESTLPVYAHVQAPGQAFIGGATGGDPINYLIIF